MNLSKRSKLIIGAAAVLTVGGIIGGGIAWAAIAPPPTPLSPDDTMYACVSTAGKVKSGTLKLNVAPTTCPNATDTVKSWNPQGTEGPQGPPGAAASTEFRAGKAQDQFYEDGPFFAAGPYPPVFVQVTFDAEEFDTNDSFDPATSTFTVPSDGYYSLAAQAIVGSPPAPAELILAVNGNIYARLDRQVIPGNTNPTWTNLSGTSVQRLSTGDTVQVWLYTGAGAAEIQRNGDQNLTGYDYRNASFFGYRIGDAAPVE